MRLYEIYSERDQFIKNVAAYIKTECQPFINEVNGDISHYVMFRGIPALSPNARANMAKFTIVKCPVGREPSDTPYEIHQAADNYFLEKTGIRFRSNSFFVTGDINLASSYGSDSPRGEGNDYMLFPMGRFSYCWSPRYYDFYEAYNEDPTYFYGYDDDLQPTDVNPKEDLDSLVANFIDNGNYKFNNGLTQALKTKHEVMVHCKTAFILKIDFYKYLKEIQNLIHQ